MMLCVDVGASFVDLAIMQADGRLVRRRRAIMPLDDWPALVAILRQACVDDAEMLAADRPVAIALAGLLDTTTGVVTSANLSCLDGRTVAADLSAELGRPVRIENDANCFALAEAFAGAGRGHDLVFGLVLGSGVGGGLIAGGRLLVSNGIGGEWGHGPIVQRPSADAMATQLPYVRCGCGQWGCLDTVGAARGLERLHRHLHGATLSSSEITQRWLAGELDSSDTIARHVNIVSGVLAMLLNSFPATIVPVGGGLANCEPLIDRLDMAVRARILRQADRPLLVRGFWHDDAGLIGAAIAAGASVDALVLPTPPV